MTPPSQQNSSKCAVFAGTSRDGRPSRPALFLLVARQAKGIIGCLLGLAGWRPAEVAAVAMAVVENEAVAVAAVSAANYLRLMAFLLSILFRSSSSDSSGWSRSGGCRDCRRWGRRRDAPTVGNNAAEEAAAGRREIAAAPKVVLQPAQHKVRWGWRDQHNIRQTHTQPAKVVVVGSCNATRKGRKGHEEADGGIAATFRGRNVAGMRRRKFDGGSQRWRATNCSEELQPAVANGGRFNDGWPHPIHASFG
jgi:hypothetical protein